MRVMRVKVISSCQPVPLQSLSACHQHRCWNREKIIFQIIFKLLHKNWKWEICLSCDGRRDRLSIAGQNNEDEMHFSRIVPTSIWCWAAARENSPVRSAVSCIYYSEQRTPSLPPSLALSCPATSYTSFSHFHLLQLYRLPLRYEYWVIRERERERERERLYISSNKSCL